MDYKIATIKNLAELMRGQKTCILIGAGVSVSAGIPVAKGLCEELKKNYPDLMKDDLSYFEYMSLLPRGTRKQFLRNQIKKSRVNTSYISLAALVKEGYINRILTTNFDLLIEKALSFYKYRPAIYDCTCNNIFIDGDVQQLSLFYLHGKSDGFILLNTEPEINSLRSKLTDLFNDSNRNRLWIIIGYSGNDKPVFDGIKSIENYEHGLFWVSTNEEPTKNVQENILSKEDTYFISIETADQFFEELAKELKIDLLEYSRPKMKVNLNEIDIELNEAGLAEASKIFRVDKNDIECLAYKIYNNNINTFYLHRIFIKKIDFNLITDEYRSHEDTNLIKALINKKEISLNLEKSHQFVPTIVGKDGIVLEEDYNTPAMLHAQISYIENENNIEAIEFLITKYLTPLNLCGYVLDKTPKLGNPNSLAADDLYKNESYKDKVIDSVSRFYWPFSLINLKRD